MSSNSDIEKTEDQNIQSKAWKILRDETDLKIGQRMFIRSSFSDFYKKEYPFISRECKKGKVEYYYSEIKEISNLRFDSEKEVILANAIYENIKEDFNPNMFMQQLKFTFRILGVDSNWAK